ncbi:MAG: triose-phosphate isomerase [Rickettsiales bacterium]|jgi:triosephosphate isomerase|nr:triose-phosphate isomerase [Rickettsiales bacterium]
MQKIISGNWKMNGSRSDLNRWFEDFFGEVLEFEKNLNQAAPIVLICVPTIYIGYAENLAIKYNERTKYIKINIGCQDIHVEERGAYTGSNSVVFVGDFDLKYTLIGHSERRQYERETDEIVAKKAINAIKNSITPIVCVGESLEVRDKQQHLSFIEEQVLKSTNGVDINRIIIAYEPVWAIGTGKVPTLNEIEEINSKIKEILGEIPVLYGGSVKSSNTKDITSLRSVDGVLVGGASLKGEEFFNILKNSIL